MATTEDTALTVDLAPAAAAGVTFTIVAEPEHGTLSAVAGHTVTYTPASDFSGSDSIRFAAVRGSERAEASVDITITPVDDTSVANNDTLTVAEGATASTLDGGATSLLTNDTDVDGNAATASLSVPPSHGVVTINPDGTFSYVHDGSEATSDTFTYSAGSLGIVSITVTPVNDPVTATADAFSLLEAALAIGNVKTNDLDADGDATVSLVTPPTHGAVTLSANGEFSYQHDGNDAFDTDQFTYELTDGISTSTGTASFAITIVNNAPTAVNDVYSVNEGSSFTYGAVAGVLANDSDDEGAPLSAVLDVYVQHGSALLNPDGSLSYYHDGSESTADTLTYLVSDGVNTSSGSVQITVIAVNDPPEAFANAMNVTEGGTATGLLGGLSSVLDNDTDAEGNTLTAQLVTPPSHGSLSLGTNGTLSYTHDGTENFSDSFTYRAYDSFAYSAPTTVTITISPVNDPPVAANHAFTVLEDLIATQANLTSGHTSLLSAASDPDTLAGSFTVQTSPVTPPLHGALSLSANGNFSYDHDGSETTSDSFQYRIFDGAGGQSTGTVTITVTPVNDAPVVALTVNGPTQNTSKGFVHMQMSITDADAVPGEKATVNCEWSTNGTTWTAISAGNTFPSTLRDFGLLQAAQVIVPAGEQTATANLEIHCRADDTIGVGGPGAYGTTGPFTLGNRKVIYVAPTSTAPHDGTSWTNAFNDLNAALTAAETGMSLPLGREVWVKAGTYVPVNTGTLTGRFARFQLANGVKLFGGFAGTETVKEQRVEGMNTSILDGHVCPSPGTPANCVHVVQMRSGSQIDGFSITGGVANSAQQNNFDAYGGGIGAQDTSGTVMMSNLVLYDNSATFGAAIAVNTPTSAFTAYLQNIDAHDNTTTNAGGIIHFGMVGPKTIRLSNVLIHHNDSPLGAALMSIGASVAMEHMTIKGNTTGPTYSALVGCGGGTAIVRNTVLWGNTNVSGVARPFGGCSGNDNTTMQIGYSNVQGSGGSSAWVGTATDIGGNLDVDPLFVGVGSVNPLDLQLQAASPSVNTGTSTTLCTDLFDEDFDSLTTEALLFDISGQQRLVGAARDMGAYER